MTQKTTPFDPAEFLNDEISQAKLIAEALETGDAAFISEALNTVVRSRNVTNIAEQAGITRKALYKAIRDGDDPKVTTLLDVTRALGIQINVQPTPAKP